MSIEKVLPVMLPLVSDRVANVRLALAALMRGQLLAEGSPFTSHPITQQMLAALREDTDRDVLRLANADVEGYEPPRYRCKRPDPPPSSTARADATDAAADAAADEDSGVAHGQAGNGSAVDLAPPPLRAEGLAEADPLDRREALAFANAPSTDAFAVAEGASLDEAVADEMAQLHLGTDADLAAEKEAAKAEAAEFVRNRSLTGTALPTPME